MRTRSVLTHSTQAVLEGALIATLVVGLMAGTAFAGRGGGGKPASGGTVAVVLLDSADDVANRGELVTFDVKTTATDRPFVGLRCWQGSAWVYDAYVGFFPSYMFDPWLTLSSTYWDAGAAATCTARLFYYDKRGTQKVLATTDFGVAP